MTYTDSDFDQYRNAVLHWMEKLGLSGWRVDFIHKQDDVSARTTYELVGRLACFHLSKESTGDYCHNNDVEALALHEVLHLLVADLVWTAATEKNDSSDLVIAREHEFIHRVLPVLLGRVQ